MKRQQTFFQTVCVLAIPAALQSMLQSSFGMVDQIMIGQLGEISVAGVGMAGKFVSIYSVIVAAVAAVAGIMISQYLGQEKSAEVRRSFFANLALAAVVAGLFSVVCALFPEAVMRAYTKDAATRQAAAEYLRYISATFLPVAGATLLSTAFRCAEKPRLPLYSSIFSALLNTGLNYVLIFGKLGFPALGVTGAAIATVVSQCANVLCMLLMAFRCRPVPKAGDGGAARWSWRTYLAMLLPLLLCEGSWSLGENVYAAIYGHMGTGASAAMTLINPVQGLVIGALCGLSQAAGVIVGKQLGRGEREAAYRSGKRLLVYGALGALILSAAVVLLREPYVDIYRVDGAVKAMTRQILLAYAMIAPCKVLNMILGGGILRSGGRTKYIMAIDMTGTWCLGVPLGLLSAFIWKLSIPYVYFILSLEECFRLAVSLAVFRRRSWMDRLGSGAE